MPRTGGSERHHLICRSCGRSAEVPGAALERWMAAAAGQRLTPITAEVFGTCTGCRAAARRPAES